MDTALCLHNATVLTGFSVMKKCAVYIKDNYIADVYNEERFKQKKFDSKVKIIDVKGAYSSLWRNIFHPNALCRPGKRIGKKNKSRRQSHG